MKTFIILALLAISCYSRCKECEKENLACQKAGVKCVSNFLMCSYRYTDEQIKECFAPYDLAKALYQCQKAQMPNNCTSQKSEFVQLEARQDPSIRVSNDNIQEPKIQKYQKNSFFQVLIQQTIYIYIYILYTLYYHYQIYIFNILYYYQIKQIISVMISFIRQ